MESIARPYGYVYIIQNERTGHAYVGQTVQMPSARWTQHKSELKSGQHRNLHYTVYRHDTGVCSLLAV